MKRNAQPSGIACDAITKGMRFGYWEVLDPEPVKAAYTEGGNSHTNPRQAFIRCRCTFCGKTERNVRRSYLLNGHSKSCGCYKAARLRRD